MLGFNPWLVVILGAVIVGATGASYLKGRADGKAVVIAAQASAAAKYDAQVKAQEIAARAASQASGHAIEVTRNERDAQAGRARAALRPVRVFDDPGPAVPRAADPTPAADDPEAPEERPVRAGRDIGPALVMLAERCQRDVDDAVAWREWWDAIARARVEGR